MNKLTFQINFKRTMCMVFVRHPKSEPDKITIDFDYPYKLNSFKRFSFSRSKTEQISSFLYRLKAKMNVEIEKSLKKKKISVEDVQSILISSATVINEAHDLTSDFDNMALEDVLIASRVLQIGKYDYNIVVNSPIIHSVKLSKIIMSKCPIIPMISMEYGDTTDLQYEWFISKTKSKWEKISSDYVFTPQSIHVNHYLKIKCIYPATKCYVEKISDNVIQECPQQTSIESRWEHTPGYIYSPNRFRIISYNLLSDIYCVTSTAKEQIFRHCPVDYLKMDYRQGLLLREIANYHSDIICLQEVDSKIFANYLQPYLLTNGFDSLFQLKDIESMEGQAIFWRKSKFKLIEDISIKSISKLIFENENADFTEIRNLLRKSAYLLRHWIKLKQCMVGCVLQSIDEIANLIVTNTHLYFRPEAEQLRMLQIATILSRIESTKRKYGDSRIVMTGDFNAMRADSTVSLVLNGSSDSEVSLRHPFSFLSAYEASFTNYTLDFSNELDYIFYDRTGLTCERIVPLSSLEDVTAEQALPNKDFPSDHLALVADFAFEN